MACSHWGIRFTKGDILSLPQVTRIVPSMQCALCVCWMNLKGYARNRLKWRSKQISVGGDGKVRWEKVWTVVAVNVYAGKGNWECGWEVRNVAREGFSEEVTFESLGWVNKPGGWLGKNIPGKGSWLPVVLEELPGEVNMAQVEWCWAMHLG